jgi:hypothetical protein
MCSDLGFEAKLGSAEGLLYPQDFPKGSLRQHHRPHQEELQKDSAAASGLWYLAGLELRCCHRLLLLSWAVE